MSTIFAFLHIFLGLWLERWGAAQQLSWMHSFIALTVIAHLAFHFRRAAQPLRLQLLACLLFSTLGELILSAVFGLYHYRDSLLPLFVPPGHVLLFLAGIAFSHSIFLQNYFCRSLFTGGIFLAVALEFALHRNLLSPILLIGFFLALNFGPNPKLYISMFWLALGLEWIGTSFGSWAWNRDHLLFASIPNPPIAAGVFYIALDLLSDFDYTKSINNSGFRRSFPRLWARKDRRTNFSE